MTRDTYLAMGVGQLRIILTIWIGTKPIYFMIRRSNMRGNAWRSFNPLHNLEKWYFVRRMQTVMPLTNFDA